MSNISIYFHQFTGQPTVAIITRCKLLTKRYQHIKYGVIYFCKSDMMMSCSWYLRDDDTIDIICTAPTYVKQRLQVTEKDLLGEIYLISTAKDDIMKPIVWLELQGRSKVDAKLCPQRQT